MPRLEHALQGGLLDAPPAAPTASAAAPMASAGSLRAAATLVVGGGGTLGSAVLEQLLARQRRGPVRVLTQRGLTVAMAGLQAVDAERLGRLERLGPLGRALADDAPGPPPAAAIADSAVVVFDRERRANGREQAFFRPHPQALAGLGAALRRHGVRRLVVVLPHSPAGLPAALKTGLANLDEQAVAALGFEQLVFVRTAQAPAGDRSGRWLQRLADGVLAQLRIMVPASQQPVRPQKVAQFVVELVAGLPSGPAGTRVAPPELIWQAAQQRDPGPLAEAWLSNRPLPPSPGAPPPRW